MATLLGHMYRCTHMITRTDHCYAASIVASAALVVPGQEQRPHRLQQWQSISSSSSNNSAVVVVGVCVATGVGYVAVDAVIVAKIAVIAAAC